MKVEREPFIVCESAAAVTTHLREIGEGHEPINYGGFARRPIALCGASVAWDTKLPTSTARCSKCVARRAAIEQKREDAV